MATVRIYTSLILDPTYHYLCGSNMNLTAVLFWKIKTTPSPCPPPPPPPPPRSEYDVIKAWNCNPVLVILQFVTGKEPCAAGGRAYSVGEVSSAGVFVLSRPPISYRYRCTSDSLPAFSLENSTGQKLTNWLYRPDSDIRIGPRWDICAKLRLCLSPQNCIPVQISNTKNFSVYGLRPSPPTIQQTKHFGSRFGSRNILFPFEHQAMPEVQKTKQTEV